MSTLIKAKTHPKMRFKKVHGGVFVAEKRRHDYQLAAMKTSISAEHLDRLALMSMESILNCDPKNATFSEI